MSCRDDMELVDVVGKPHPLSKVNVCYMLVAGWIFFFGSFCFHALYYKIHPSSTDISISALCRRLNCQKEHEKTGIYYSDSIDRSLLQSFVAASSNEKKPDEECYYPYLPLNLYNIPSHDADSCNYYSEIIDRRRQPPRSNWIKRLKKKFGYDAVEVEDRDLFMFEYGY